MKCYEEFSTPNVEKEDGCSRTEFLCEHRKMKFYLYIGDDLGKCSTEKYIDTCAGVMRTALSVCYQCPLFRQGSDSECNSQ